MKKAEWTGLFCRFHRERNSLRCLVALITAYNFFFVHIAFSQQIVLDGKTQTQLQINKNVTDVTTSTIRGHNAYNSFYIFDVYSGNVVNLHVPNGAENLLNLVHSKATTIDGILNSIKNGQIGGNVFFANPYGFVVGAGGVVNVGALTVVTPTKSFMDGFFDFFSGDPSPTATSMLLNRTVPISPDGLISVRGKINAIKDINLLAGNVTHSGLISSGAVFAGSKVDFSDVVNVNNLQTGAKISIENGDIYIRAANDVESSGIIKTDGGDNLNAGRIDIQAGNDVKLNDGSLLLARSVGENSSAGSITVLADRNVEIRGNQYTDGVNLTLRAESSIAVSNNVILSTRNLNDVTTEDHLTAISRGSSGNLTLEAPQITVNSGAKLLAHAINENGTTFQAGDITLSATDKSVWTPVVNVDNTTAKITLNGATLKGKDVKLEVTADSSRGFDDNGTPSNATLNFFEGLSLLAGVAVSNADAEVIINGASNIEASTLTMNATAKANATVNTISTGLGVAVGITNPTAKVIVGDGTNPVVINTTGDVKLKSTAVSYLDVNALTATLGAGRGSSVDVTFSYGESTIESTAQISKGVDAGKTGGTGGIGGSLDVKAEMVKNQKVSALGGAYEDGSIGAAAAISLSTSHANALVDGAVHAEKGITVFADSQTPRNDTSASADAGSSPLTGAIVGAANYLVDVIEKRIFKATPDPRSGSSSKFKFSGTVAYAEHENNALARIGDSAEVSSELSTPSGPMTDGILVKSYVKDVPETSAISIVNSDLLDQKGGNTAQNSISAAVVIGDFSNNATASIGRNAVVNAKNPITVTSKTEIPWEIQWLNIDSDNLDGTLFPFIKDKLNPNLGLQNGFFTSWAQSMAQGTKTAVAGSVNILSIDNTSRAYIDEGAKVNQDVNYRSDLQDVKVMAENEMETLNLSGIFGLANIRDLLSVITGGKVNPAVKPGTAGVGGSYLQVRYDNIVQAEIKKDAKVYAESLQVEADTTSRNISIGEAGGKAGKYAINGAVSLLTTNDTTVAKIDDGATIVTNAKVIPGDTENNNILVKAKDESQIYNISGGISKGDNVGVGVSVSINEITRGTEALIGNRLNETDEPEGSVSSEGNIKVAAANVGLISSWSLAAAVATKELEQYDWPEDGVNPQSPKGAEMLKEFMLFRMKNPKPQYGLGISGDVSVNLISDTAEAYIKDATVANATQLEVKATNNSEIDALAGSVTLTKADGKSFGLAGSVTWNELTNTTKAYVDHSTLGVTGDLNLTADSTGTIKTIAASGSGAVSRISDSGIGVAGSLAYNYIDNQTSAYINNSDVSSDTSIADNISLSALDGSTIWSVAGAGSYGGKAGIGASIAVNRMGNSTEAYAKDSDLKARGNILISADKKSEIITVSAAVGIAKDGMAIAASASGNDLSNTTKAYISGKKADGTFADENISLAANDDLDVLSVAGNLMIAKGSRGVGGVGFGGSASVTVTDNTVEAFIGTGSKVTAKGEGGEMAVYTGKKDGEGNKLTEIMKGISITATSYEDILSVAVGGAGAEKLSIEGSAAVHVLDEKTKAYIDAGAVVTAGETAGTEQSINLLASDTTDILGIAGAAMGSLKGGIGAGADVGVITKETQAYIGSSADVDARENVKIQASSSEDINSIAGTIALGKDWAFGGAASVYVIDNTTKAYVGEGQNTKVHSDGNILISSYNETEIDSIAGSGVFGMSAGIGASATVAIITKTTEAFIGKYASVSADGKRAEINVNTGKFIVQTPASAPDDYGVDPSDTQNLNLNTEVDPVTTSAPETKRLKGLAVTAIAKDDLSSIAASGGGSGSIAVNLAGSVNVVSNNTSAYIGEGAKINGDNSSADSNQSVLVAAGTDFYHMGIGAAVSIGGNLGLGPAVEVTVIDNNTYAYIGKSAQVKAKKDVEVIAESSEDILSITGAGALGVGVAGLAGSVSVISIDNETFAYVEGTTGSETPAAINADGNVVISSKDKTDTDIISGSLAGGLFGIGGAVGVTDIEKDTKAFVGNHAVVNAKGNSDNVIGTYSGELSDQGEFVPETMKGLSVRAESSEDFFTITGAFAGGFAGLAGAVVVNTIESNTIASIGDSAKVNKDNAGASSEQTVNVSAVNHVNDFSVSGSVAGGAVGISGGLGFHTIKNNTSAYLGNGAEVNAAWDVKVNALSNKETETYAASAAGGLVGLAGGVTILTIGTMPDDSAAKSLSEKGGNDGFQNPSGYAESQARYDFMNAATTDSYGMGDAKSKAAEATSNIIVSPTSVPGGTSAFIGKSATVNAGNDIAIKARERIDVDMLSGGGALGLASIGGSVGIADIRSQVKAYIDDDDPALSSSISAKGNINISAVLNEKTENEAYAGGISVFLSVSGAVTYIDEDYLVDAHVGKKVNIAEAGDISVRAMTSTDDTSKSLEGGFSGLVAGGVSYAEVDSDGYTMAYVGDQAKIGVSDGKTVRNLDAGASSSNKARTESKHLSGGILGGVGYNKSDASVNPTVIAAIGPDVKIHLQEDLILSAHAAVDFNSTASSKAFGAIGWNGVRIENNVSSTAKAYIDQDADVEADKDLSITASNTVAKSNIGTNLSAGAGGLLGRPAGDSVTNITSAAESYIAGNSASSGTERVTAGLDLTLFAANDIFAYDKATLTAGGPIAVADVNSAITNTNTAKSYIGEHAQVEAANDVNVHSKTKADVETVTYTEAYGLGASADGTAEVTLTANNGSNVDPGAKVKAGNDLNLIAGMALDDWQNSLRARAEARSFSAGGIPISSLTANAFLNNYNDVLVGSAADLKSGRDINLGAFKGFSFVEGYAKAKMRTYLLFGIPITWYNDGSRQSVPQSRDSVTMNGTAESGLNRYRILHIDGLGSVLPDSNIGYLFRPNIDGAAELQTRIDDLNAQMQSATDNNVKIILAQDKARYEARRDEILAKRNDPNNPDPTYGYFDRFSVEDTTAGSGNINVTGTLKGTGLLKVPGNDFLIEIQNDSLAHLELNNLEIPADLSGRVLLNNRPITSHTTLTIDPEKNLGKRIVVENRYDPDAPGADENAASDMILRGNIVNQAGTIDIVNLSGSIESLGDIIGDEVTIFARREFAQNYTPGVWNSPDPLIAGGNISISGQILNIKGTIQSGIPYRTITIPEFNPDTDLVTKGNVWNVIPTTGSSNIMAVWDAENQCIQLYSVKIIGGNITLAGEIVSTGGGKLKVIDGYGEIEVTNHSSKDMVINKLDVGNRINGMIKITDTGKLDAQGNPLVTEISGDNGNLKVVQYRVRWDQQDGQVKVVENSQTVTPVDGRMTEYQPRPGARFMELGKDNAISNKKPLNWLEALLLSIFGKKGDYSIGVEFTGSSEPRIEVTNTSSSNLLLNNNILNRDGDVSIRNEKGNIYSLNGASEIWGRNISLSAPEGDIGSTKQAVGIDTRGGVLNAVAKGMINIEEVEGDLTLQSVTTQGNVKLTAEGSILDLNGNSATIIAKDISLLSRNGGIGTANNDLTIHSSDGILTAEATQSIYLTETNGGMRVNKVISTQGDVILTATGPIEDYNFSAGQDEDTLEQVASAKHDLSLNSEAKVQEAIDALKKQKKEEYQAAHRISDNGTPFEPKDDTYDSTYDPNWEYTLTQAEKNAFAQSLWKDQDLVNAKNIITMPGGETAPEEPNVSGRNVTLITHAGLGIYGGNKIIRQADIASGNVTPAQRQMLILAEQGEITYDKDGNLIISLDKNFNVNATGKIDIRAKDHIYLETGKDPVSILLNVSGRGGRAEVTEAYAADQVKVNADNIILGNIMHTTSANPLRFDISGHDGQWAETVAIGTNSRAAILFDNLKSDVASVDARANELRFLDTLIGTRADFNNNFYKVIVDNKDKSLHNYDVVLQLYAKDLPFYLYFTGVKKLFTNAFIVNYDDDFIINDFSTENSITRLVPKLLAVTGYPSETIEGNQFLTVIGFLFDYGRFNSKGSVIFDPTRLGIEDKNAIKDENEISIISE